MSVQETLGLVDRVTGPANKMAAAMGKLDAATKSTQRSLNASGKSAAALAKTDRAAKMTAKSVTGIGRAAGGAQKEAKKLDEKDALGAIGLGGAIGSGILTAVAGLALMGKAISTAAGLAKDLAVSFTESLIEAKLTRDAAESMMNTLSGGRGAEVLGKIKQQAIATNQSLEEVRKTTIKSREAGASLAEAFKINLLRGDIKAATNSVEKADQAIDEMLGRVKSGSITAAKGMAELKEKFGVAGNGALAAKKASEGLGSALQRLKDAPAKIFDEIAKKAGPKLDELGTKVSTMINKFNESGQAAAMIDRIVAGVTTLIDIVMIAGELFGPLWQGFQEGIAPLGPLVDALGEALGTAFGEDKASTMQTLASAAKLLGQAIAVALGATVVFVGILGALAAAVIAPVAAIGLLVYKFASISKAGADAAIGLISGLVQGIRDGIGKAVKAAEELAAAVKAKIKDALKIGSPSKVFAEFGGNVATGFAQGISAGVGEAEKAGGQMAAAPMASAAATTGKAGGGGSGGSPFTLQLNVSASPGATAADGEALASGIVPVIRREIASFFEGQLLEAGA